MCAAAVCAAAVLVGLVAWIVCWRMFLILCCFCCLVCVAAVCEVGVLVGLLVCILYCLMFLILRCFLLPTLCGGCLCSCGSSGTASVE